MTNQKNNSRSNVKKYVILIVCVIAVCALSFTTLSHHGKHSSRVVANQKYQ
ncbi:MAG: hypothetical protein Q8934_12750 [Bacillota bacterium]|nr:hypothetical protein [Bacillota bacterium]